MSRFHHVTLTIGKHYIDDRYRKVILDDSSEEELSWLLHSILIIICYISFNPGAAPSHAGSWQAADR